jgi:alpha-tubulin suppressor-like RCC1 family protein
VILRPKLGRKERGGGKNQDDNQCVLHTELLQFHSFQHIELPSIPQQPRSSRTSHPPFVVQRQDILHPRFLPWLPFHHARRLRHGLDVRSQRACIVGRRRSRVHLRERANKTPRVDFTWRVGETRFVHAACGRNHSILVGSEGQVWSTGANNLGQCGHPPCPEVPTWQQVKGTFGGGRVFKAAAGITFSIVLTEQGRREWATYISFQALTPIPVFSFGSGEHGQLGNGRTGEHIITGNKTAYDVSTTILVSLSSYRVPRDSPQCIYRSAVAVKALDGKHITQIACGPQHSIALDSEGVVYVWGYNGYCRLGLGHQKDILSPTPVPHVRPSTQELRDSTVFTLDRFRSLLDPTLLAWVR